MKLAKLIIFLVKFDPALTFYGDHNIFFVYVHAVNIFLYTYCP